MRKTFGFATTLTAVGLAAALGGCAAQPSATKTASIFGSKDDNSNLALATRAQAALSAGDLANAVKLAEQAVGNTPNDAGYRALLGNIYFASGRFASAEAAFRDSLALLPNQPQLVLKMALAETAQGKGAQARGLLYAARDVIDPSDYGLAMALSGDTGEAIATLTPAARAVGADARVRQNLALAHALAGNWAIARQVAAQDLSPADLDARLQQWMTMASPASSGNQVASLLGVTPVADAGMPARLALNGNSANHAMIRQAEGQALAANVAAPQPAVEIADAAPVDMPAEAAPVDIAPAPVAMAAVTPVAPVAPVAAPVAKTASVEPVRAAPVASLAMSMSVAATSVAIPTVVKPAAPAAVASVKAKPAAKPVREAAARPALSPRAASLTVETPGSRLAAASAKGGKRGKIVVQLGAYSAKDRVSLGWNRLSGKFTALRGYSPMSARYDLPGGTVYRLSVHGFETRQKAVGLCGAIKKGGGTCFVREVAGDARINA